MNNSRLSVVYSNVKFFSQNKREKVRILFHIFLLILSLQPYISEEWGVVIVSVKQGKDFLDLRSRVCKYTL